MTDILKIKQNNQWVSIPAIKGDPGEDGVGIPEGGTTGQVLAKASGDDYDTEWVTKTIPTNISDLTDDTSTNPIDKADTLTGLTATVSELNHMDGVTSNVQIQLDNKSTSSDISTAISTLLSTMYPIGAIYIGTQATCPMSSLISGSTWELVGSDKVLQGAGTRGAVGTTINESLPNITGEYRPNTNVMAFRESPVASGGFQASSYTYSGDFGAGYTSVGNCPQSLILNASSSSSIYQNNAHVQPDAYLVNIWRRTA